MATKDHDELVRRAIRWLQHTVGCCFVLHELVSVLSLEIPDAIGWRGTKSHLVECKATRSDFLADAQKFFRQRHPELGIGVYRYYMTYPTLIQPDELPDRWGLLWVYPKVVKVVRHAFPFDARDAAVAELPLLCSALRRIALRGDLEAMLQTRPS